MECWWPQPSSHDGSVHMHFRERSVTVSGTQVMLLVGTSRTFNINSMGPFSTLDPFSAASSTSSALYGSTMPQTQT